MPVCYIIYAHKQKTSMKKHVNLYGENHFTQPNGKHREVSLYSFEMDYYILRPPVLDLNVRFPGNALASRATAQKPLP